MTLPHRAFPFRVGLVFALALAALAVAVPTSAWAQVASVFGRYHALVIGNNDYRHFDKLKTAVADAETVAQVLRSDYGFEVRLLKNATRADIIGAFDDFRARLKADDNLLVYYAGHGHLEEVENRGYWLPVDAERTTTAAWIANDDITAKLRSIRAQHVLVVADSCYSGTLTRAVEIPRVAEARSEWVARMTKTRSRSAFTSGGLEPVADTGSGGHSVFAAAFLRALHDNRESVAPARALADPVAAIVALNSQQTPRYAEIREAASEGGEFFFVRTRGATTAALSPAAPAPNAPSGPASPGASAEVVFWQSIQASEDAALYREYLKQFPSGTFAGLARRKIEQLEKPLPPQPVVPNQQQAAVTPPPQAAAPAPAVRPAVGSFPTAFPTGPIRLVVPFPPGGGVDVIARTVAQSVSALLGQPVIIENRAGASGTIGTAAVAKATPDGYTLLVAANPHVTNRFVMKDVPYDGVRDFAPVALLASGGLVLAVHPALPARDYREFVQLLKSRPDAFNHASSGTGSLSHLTAEWFKAKAGVRAVHVPYRGTAPAIADTAAGQVQFMFESVASLKSHIDAGRLRALAVTGPTRSPQLASVPTTQELGLDSVTVWYAILAPAQVPAPIVGKLNAAFGQAMADPRVAESVAALGLVANAAATPEAVSRFLGSEVAKWGTVVQAAGIKPE